MSNPAAGVRPATSDPLSSEPLRSPWLMLVMATLGFALNFWAWALLSPLGPLFAKTQEPLGPLSESQVALMVAVPVLVGSLGRIIVGALTDVHGGRLMFPLVSVITIIPILFIAYVAINSFALLLVGGFFLGIAGTAFAVGVPFVNAWFPPEKRGLAVGIFGAGMGGTAISALTTVPLYERGDKLPFLITAAALAVYAVLAWVIMRDAPGRTVPTTSLGSRLVATSKLAISWQACILYAVAFGGYVAFSVYLPAYLRTAYDLATADASNRMAGFVVIAVLCRPLGGWLSDKFGSIPILTGVYVLVAVGAALSAGAPPLEGIGTAAFLLLAAALGVGTGATFALIAHVTEPSRVGGVTGLVGAAGGLGGFVPPLLMGWIYGRTQSYSWGMWLLVITALLTLLLTLTVVRRTAATAKAGATS